MKTKISKILGVLVTLATLMSVFVSAIPVSAAIMPHTWDEVTLPGPEGYIMPGNSASSGFTIVDSGPLTQAPDGTLYVYVETDEAAPLDHSILKSTNGGRSWAVTGTDDQPTGTVKTLVAYGASNVYYTVADKLFRSTDGGVNFDQIASTPVGAGDITALDVGTSGGRNIIAIAADNAYWVDEGNLFLNMQLIGTPSFLTTVGAAPIAIKFSSNFATDSGVAAIGANGVVSYDVFGGAWGAIIGAAAAVGAVTAADIHFPSDWNASTSRNFFFSTNVGGVYQFIGGAPGLSATVQLTTSAVMGATFGGNKVSSLDVSGTFTGATLFAGITGNSKGITVITSTNGGGSWSAAKKGAYGNTPLASGISTYVLMKNDFATSGAGYALVEGRVANDQSGLSITADKGVSWNQVSLINSSEQEWTDMAPSATSTFVSTIYEGGSDPNAAGTFTLTAGSYTDPGTTVAGDYVTIGHTGTAAVAADSVSIHMDNAVSGGSITSLTVHVTAGTVSVTDLSGSPAIVEAPAGLFTVTPSANSQEVLVTTVTGPATFHVEVVGTHDGHAHVASYEDVDTDITGTPTNVDHGTTSGAITMPDAAVAGSPAVNVMVTVNVTLPAGGVLYQNASTGVTVNDITNVITFPAGGGAKTIQVHASVVNTAFHVIVVGSATVTCVGSAGAIVGGASPDWSVVLPVIYEAAVPSVRTDTHFTLNGTPYAVGDLSVSFSGGSTPSGTWDPVTGIIVFNHGVVDPAKLPTVKITNAKTSAIADILVTATAFSETGTHNNPTMSVNGATAVSFADTAPQSQNTGALALASLGTNRDSIWRYDGTNWERVFMAPKTLLPTSGTTPTWATNSVADTATRVDVTTGAVFYWAPPSGYFGSIVLTRSTDNGQTWSAQSANVGATFGAIDYPMLSVLPIDKDTQLVGSAGGKIVKTITNGLFWTEAVADAANNIGNVLDMDRASNGDILAGGLSSGVARVALSKDGGLTWKTITVDGDPNLPDAGSWGTIEVGFSSSYATTGEIYVAGGSVYRYNYKAASPEWQLIDDSYSKPEAGSTTTTTTTSVKDFVYIFPDTHDQRIVVQVLQGTVLVEAVFGPPDSISYDSATKTWTANFDGSWVPGDGIKVTAIGGTEPVQVLVSMNNHSGNIVFSASDTDVTTPLTLVEDAVGFVELPHAGSTTTTTSTTTTNPGNVGWPAGLVTALGGPQGMLYVADADGMVRFKSNDALKASKVLAERIDTPEDVAFYADLWATTGSNILWTIGYNDAIEQDAFYRYVDMLAIAPAAVAHEKIAPTTATVKWTAVDVGTFDGDVNYLWVVSTEVISAEPQLARAAAGVITGVTDELSVKLTGLTPNTLYNYKVWVWDPVTSFAYTGTSSFTTQLEYPVTPMNLVPALGASNVPVTPQFAWDSVTGATSYTLQITAANDPSFASPVFNKADVPAVTGPTATFNYTGALTKDTSYIWRVKANGTTSSEWVNGNFQTIPAPPPVVNVPPATSVTLSVPPMVTVNIPTQTPAPVPTINLPQPTVIVNPAPITVTIPPGTTLPAPTLVLPEAETPVYIWIIVAVGALLTVAVIVLIIRTRRVV